MQIAHLPIRSAHLKHFLQTLKLIWSVALYLERFLLGSVPAHLVCSVLNKIALSAIHMIFTFTYFLRRAQAHILYGTQLHSIECRPQLVKLTQMATATLPPRNLRCH